MRWLFACCVAVVCWSPVASADDVDPQAWLTARGVKDPEKQLGDTCCCTEVVVGGEPALRCSEETDIGAENQSADIAVREVIRVVRAHKVVKVLEAWTTVENMDLPPRTPPAIELEVTLDRTGRIATLKESARSRASCDHLARATDERSRYMARVCASRGTYRWRHGRFVR